MDDSSTSITDLDTSWIEKEQKLHTIDKNYCREPMHEIQIHIVYIDCLGSISNVRSDLHPCDSTTNNQQYMSKERLLKIIQTAKQSDSKKYVLFEMMLFVVELEPQHIQEYSYTDNKWCKIYTMVNDIPIPPSIFIFHSTNGLFVFLKEIEVVENKPLRSILRISETDGGTSAKKHTKKVRISEHNQVRVFAKHKKTRKHHDS